MKLEILAVVLAVVAIVIGGYAALNIGKVVVAPSLGAAATCDGSQSTTCLTGNLKLVDGGFQLGAATACIMVNPTSTATTVKLQYLGVATTSANGFVTWAFGTCL